jgi:hypothetical protein
MPTYEGTILDTGGAVINVRSSAYGATGNGVTDDTAAIQAAVNAAVDAAVDAGRGIVLIPPGTYVVKQVFLAPGITISGYGATLLRPANQPNWTRTLSVPENPHNPPINAPGVWGGPKDSDPLVIRGLTLDGNSLNQGHDGYNLQQSHLLFLSASPSQAGRLRVTLEDVVFRNVVADGVNVFTNVDVQIVNCRADDCWRGGVNVTGGYSVVQVQNLITTGNVHRTGVDVEVDGFGYGNTEKVDLIFDGLLLDADFDVALSQGSTLVATNVIGGSGLYLEAPDSTVRIANSRFRIGASDGKIVYPSDVTFENCVFELAAPDRATQVQWEGGLTPTGQRLRFRDCDFRVAAGTAAGTRVAIYTEPDYKSRDNRLLVEGGSISSGFTIGMQMGQGGVWVVKDTEIEAGTAFNWHALHTAGGLATTADIRIERVAFRGTTYMHVANKHIHNVLDQRDVVLEELHNKITSTYGVDANEYRGGRIVRVASSPVGRSVPGFVGDVARIANPMAGDPYEWVCTVSSETAATWKQVTALAA